MSEKALFDKGGCGSRPRKQMPSDPIQAMEFAQSKGQARKDGRTGVTFADVAGCDEAVRQLQFVVEVCFICWPHPCTRHTRPCLNSPSTPCLAVVEGNPLGFLHVS